MAPTPSTLARLPPDAGEPSARLRDNGAVTLLTLLTDFGLDDYYVAAVKGTVLRLAPQAVLVDVSHGVAAGDVAAGGWLLAAAVRWFPPGTVHLGVVDPGVGSHRRILAARAGDAYLVGPDNGLLPPAVGVLADGGAAEVRSVERDDLFLPGPGSTFHGRDRFAPVAAYLARGEPLAELGPEIDDAVAAADREAPHAEGTPPREGTAGAVLRGRVVHIDRFGNLITDIPTAWVGDAPCRAEIGSHATARRAGHYREIAPRRAAVLPGSLGTLEVALEGESLAERWAVDPGDEVTVRLDVAS